jgi:isopropylmalate/homocitrate/citramalate synthase
MLRDRRSYEPFAADEIGGTGSRFVLGKHSGTTAVRLALVQCGIQPPDDHAAECLVTALRRLTVSRSLPL